MNIQERIEALETEFAEKIKVLKVEAQQENEFPQAGDDYCYIEDEGEIRVCVWGGTTCGENRSAIGNIFQTEQQAEFAVEKLKVEAELRKFSGPFENGKFNHYIFLYIDGNYVEVGYKTACHSQGTTYFESEEKAKQAINAVGEERIKKYIFGVED